MRDNNTIIDSGIIVDDTESVLSVICQLSGRNITDLGYMVRFIRTEKNTKFYVDKNLNSSVQKTENCTYLWLDTGYVDFQGNPIMISMIRSSSGEFIGHMVGTPMTLFRSAQEFFHIRNNETNRKMNQFLGKYQTKAASRNVQHLRDERQYLVDSVNDIPAGSDIANKISALNLQFEQEDENIGQQDPDSNNGATAVEENLPDDGLPEGADEITISLLWEKIEAFAAQIAILQETLENKTMESEEKIRNLQMENHELNQAMVQIRCMSGFLAGKPMADSDEEKCGHTLLGNTGRILVIGGTELGKNVMLGIAKNLGFEKKDFDFKDYDQTQRFTDRIRRDGRYKAIIWGATPHKAASIEGFNSALDKFKRIEGMPLTIDARTHAGKLSVTKTSFRSALRDIYMKLAEAA